MPESISNIVSRIDHYKDLIAKREELKKEYEDWNALFEDVEKELRLVRMIYQVGGTKEAREQLDSWLKERQDYLVMIAKYRRKIHAIDEELEELNQEAEKNQEDYLALLTELREKVVKLEKIGNKSSIGVPLAKVVNPYGHEKLIKAADVEEYNKLVSEILLLSQQLEDKYNLVFNGTSTEKLEEETKDIVDVDELEVPKDLAEKQKRLQELEAQLDALLSLSGRKKTITHAGVKYRITRANEGKIRNCISAINRLKREIGQAEIIADTEIEQKTYNESGAETDKVVKEKNIREAALEKIEADTKTFMDEEDQYYDNAASIFAGNFESAGEEYEDIYSDSSFISGNDDEYNKETEKLFGVINKHSEEARKEAGITPKEYRVEDIMMAALSKDQAEFVTDSEEEKKPSGFMKILKSRKPIDKKALKEKIKKAIPVIVAGVIVVTSLVVNSILMKLNIKKDSAALDNNDVSSSIEMVVDDVNSEVPDTNQNIDVENDYAFGVNFAVKKDSLIYENMYDATLNRNGYNAKFHHNAERQIGGVSINVNGKLEWVYMSDYDADWKLQTYLQNGGKVTSVLAVNENGSEGFYNVNDVIMLNKTLGGNSR